jgi:glycosidase
MTGSSLQRKDAQDPLTRKAWPIKKFRRDMARTPMQWDGSMYAGFTGSSPWLPADSSFPENSVSAQSASQESLLSFYRKLIWLRKSSKALQSGSISFFPEALPSALVYIREAEGSRVLVLLNFSGKLLKLAIPPWKGSCSSVSCKVLLGTHKKDTCSIPSWDKLSLLPYEVLILVLS